MKKMLIVSIVLSCTCSLLAQEKEYKWKPIKEVVFSTEQLDSLFIYDVLKIIVTFYEEYERECWNDSTEQCFNYYDSGFDKFKSPCSASDMDLEANSAFWRTAKEWIHKEPSFIDFMGYLKRKNKKNGL